MYSPLRCETIECTRRGEQFGIPGSRDKCIRDEKGGRETEFSVARSHLCANRREDRKILSRLGD